MLRVIRDEKSVYRDVKDGEYDLPYTTKIIKIKLFGITIYKKNYIGDIDSEVKIDSGAKKMGFN